ncbi:hypothetical protein GCM10022222_00580 [Amycolatopsis ultiminotia]|uniref:Uncharacterized protein n=1 Tax=Amycolatopsis ultiminotia TaxID=543629 RepID=A0ABP6UU80_9PSEU
MTADFLSEQFPLAPVDDHLIHQTPDPVRVAWSSDPRFYERYWFVLHDNTGDLMLAVGGSFYPNLDSAEAYAVVTLRGRQHSVRAFRSLGADRMDLSVGPLRPVILEGLRSWRLVLEPNAWDISFDLEWTDRTRQVYDATYGAPVPGSQPVMTAGFEGFGEVTGRVRVGGERIDWRAGDARGTRDRHWGIGRGVGGPAMNGGHAVKAGWKGGNWVRFDDFAVWGRRVLYEFGDPRPGAGRVARVDRRLRFDEETKIFAEGVLDYTFDDGSTRQVRFERLGLQTAFMRCAMYGGTPDGDVHQGHYRGGDLPEVLVEGDTYDLADPATRLRLRGLDEHHCRISWDGRSTTGVLQPLEPDAYEACKRGTPGWAFL